MKWVGYSIMALFAVGLWFVYGASWLSAGVLLLSFVLALILAYAAHLIVYEDWRGFWDNFR